MTSYDTNAQVHRTFDLLEKHGGKGVYDRIPEKSFNIFWYLYVLDVQINRAIFHLIWRGLYFYPNSQSMFRCAGQHHTSTKQVFWR